MIGTDYLEKGLAGLSRAHRANTMTGHLGAAVVAGHFFSEEHAQLDPRVHAGVEEDLNRILQGEESVFNPGGGDAVTVPGLFEPCPEEEPQEDQIQRIAEALSHNIDATRQSGHNVIFASLAIRSLTDHPEYATPSIIDGITRLIQGFDDETPGSGYYGTSRGRINGSKVSLTDEDDFPPYADQRAMAEFVLDTLVDRAGEHRQGYGGFHHIINHAAALIELSNYGYGELGGQGLAAHHHHVRLWRSLPDLTEELGRVKAAEHDPRTPPFWASVREEPDRPAELTHRVKTLYGFSKVIALVDDSARVTRAEEKLLYIM